MSQSGIFAFPLDKEYMMGSFFVGAKLRRKDNRKCHVMAFQAGCMNNEVATWLASL